MTEQEQRIWEAVFAAEYVASCRESAGVSVSRVVIISDAGEVADNAIDDMRLAGVSPALSEEGTA